MSVEVSFRLATRADLPFITRVYNDTIPSRVVTADLEPVTVESRQAWFEAHDAGRRPIWIVNFGREEAGWMGFSSFYGRPAYNGTSELSIYLDGKFHGKGVGRRALKYALETAPSLGIHTVLAFIFGSNVRSLELFGGEGFEKWALLPAVADMDGKPEDLVILGKKTGLAMKKG
jgi:L-amino acid N-acyltransferase YncA